MIDMGVKQGPVRCCWCGDECDSIPENPNVCTVSQSGQHWWVLINNVGSITTICSPAPPIGSGCHDCKFFDPWPKSSRDTGDCTFGPYPFWMHISTHDNTVDKDSGLYCSAWERKPMTTTDNPKGMLDRKLTLDLTGDNPPEIDKNAQYDSVAMTGIKVKTEQAHARLEHSDVPWPKEKSEPWWVIALLLLLTIAQLCGVALILMGVWNHIFESSQIDFAGSAGIIAVIYFIRKYVK